MEAQYVFIIYCVGYGIGMQLFFKNIISSFVRSPLSFTDIISSIVVKNRCAGKSKELRIWKEFFNRSMIISKL
jgi:hypothetical protein